MCTLGPHASPPLQQVVSAMTRQACAATSQTSGAQAGLANAAAGTVCPGGSVARDTGAAVPAVHSRALPPQRAPPERTIRRPQRDSARCAAPASQVAVKAAGICRQRSPTRAARASAPAQGSERFLAPTQCSTAKVHDTAPAAAAHGCEGDAVLQPQPRRVPVRETPPPVQQHPHLGAVARSRAAQRACRASTSAVVLTPSAPGLKRHRVRPGCPSEAGDCSDDDNNMMQYWALADASEQPLERDGGGDACATSADFAVVRRSSAVGGGALTNDTAGEARARLTTGCAKAASRFGRVSPRSLEASRATGSCAAACAEPVAVRPGYNSLRQLLPPDLPQPREPSGGCSSVVQSEAECASAQGASALVYTPALCDMRAQTQHAPAHAHDVAALWGLNTETSPYGAPQRQDTLRSPRSARAALRQSIETAHRAIARDAASGLTCDGLRDRARGMADACHVLHAYGGSKGTSDESACVADEAVAYRPHTRMAGANVRANSIACVASHDNASAYTTRRAIFRQALVQAAALADGVDATCL